MKRWMKYVKPYWKYFLFGPLCMIIEVIGEVLMPKCLSMVINNAIEYGWSYPTKIALLMVLIALTMMAGGVGGAYYGAKASVNFAADLRQDIYKKVISIFKETESVKDTVAETGLSKVKVQRILITEGLWCSRSSLEIGELYVQGLSTEEIAEKLHISPHTVKRHIENMLSKTGYKNRIDLAVNAKAMGLVVHEDDRMENRPQKGS